MSSRNTDIENVLKWIVIAIFAILALKVVATILGIAWLVGGFLVTKILPLVVLVWAALKLWQYLTNSRGTSPTPPTSGF